MDQKFGTPPMYSRPSEDTPELRAELFGRWPGLDDQDIDGLVNQYVDRSLALGLGESYGFPGWEGWVSGVLSMEVDIRPGGRALVREPGNGYALELQFKQNGLDRHRKPKLFVHRVCIVADEGVVGVPMLIHMDVHAHFLAFLLRARAGAPAAFWKLPPQWPERGKPPSIAFYRALIRYHDALKIEGRRDVAAEIARREGKNPATVRSLLRRGRKHLENEGRS